MSQDSHVTWSQDGWGENPSYRTMHTALVTATTSPSPNANSPVQDSSGLPFAVNPALQHAYAYCPSSLGLPSTYAAHQPGTIHSQEYQYAPIFGQNFAQHVNLHASAAWTTSSILPSDTTQNMDWYGVPESQAPTFENTMYSTSQGAAYDVSTAAEHSGAVNAMMSPRTSQVSQTYYEPQPLFPYYAPSSFSSNQLMVAGQHGSSSSKNNESSCRIHNHSDSLICDICGKGPFGRIYELRRHKATVHAPIAQRFLCEHCQGSFKRDDDRKRHVRTQHEGQ